MKSSQQNDALKSQIKDLVDTQSIPHLSTGLLSVIHSYLPPNPSVFLRENVNHPEIIADYCLSLFNEDEQNGVSIFLNGIDNVTIRKTILTHWIESHPLIAFYYSAPDEHENFSFSKLEIFSKIEKLLINAESKMDGADSKESELPKFPAHFIHAVKLKLELLRFCNSLYDNSLETSQKLHQKILKLIDQSVLHLNFRGIDFRRSTWFWPFELNNKDLSYIDFSEILFHGFKSRNSKFSHSDFTNARLYESRFSHCDMSNALFYKTQLKEGTRFNDSIFINSNWIDCVSSSNRYLPLFYDCNFYNVKIAKNLDSKEPNNLDLTDMIKNYVIGRMEFNCLVARFSYSIPFYYDWVTHITAALKIKNLRAAYSAVEQGTHPHNFMTLKEHIPFNDILFVTTINFKDKTWMEKLNDTPIDQFEKLSLPLKKALKRYITDPDLRDLCPKSFCENVSLMTHSFFAHSIAKVNALLSNSQPIRLLVSHPTHKVTRS